MHRGWTFVVYTCAMRMYFCVPHGLTGVFAKCIIDIKNAQICMYMYIYILVCSNTEVVIRRDM